MPSSLCIVYVCAQDYIAGSVLSIHHVDTDPFQKFVSRLTGGRFRPRCRQTVTNQIEDRFRECQQQLKDLLAKLDYVCTTADCWTSRRRCFLGITVHWLDPVSLERKGCCLAVRQLLGRHTYDVLAKALESVNNEFQIGDKTCYTVTDSGSNFLKTFRHFGLDESDVEDFSSSRSSETLSTEADHNDLMFHEINDLLVPSSVSGDVPDDDEQVTYRLPSHLKCAAHLLNLVASADTAKLEGALKRISVQTFAKLTGLWNLQNRSPIASEKIKNALGVLLVTPGATRWNSVYDSVAKIQGIISVHEQEVKFDKLCDDLIKTRLLPAQKTFISEYVRVMAPVACGLDVLQGEKAVTFGYLVPTLLIIKSRLLELMSGTNLTVCQPLASLLLNAIDRRFAHVLCDAKAKLATVVSPQFKLDLTDSAIEKEELTNVLKTAVLNLHSQESQVASTQSSSSDGVEPSAESKGDFFAGLTAKRQRKTAIPNPCVAEVDNYLADPSNELSSLYKYPQIMKLYIKLNTGLPASAAVERLFSLGGRVFSPLRANMTSEHFEMLVFLRAFERGL